MTLASEPARRGFAILCMVAGVLMLTTQDAVTKWLVADHNVGEIILYRGLVTLPLFALFTCWKRGGVRGGLRLLRSTNPRLQVLRATINSLGGLALVGSFRWMPLADAMTIFFASPILIAALSAPLLGEPVSWRRWLAILVGFMGVVLMVRPSGGGALDPIALLPLAAMGCVAFRDIITRVLGARDHSLTILFYTVWVPLPIGLVVVILLGASWPEGIAWPLFFAAGLLNLTGQGLTIHALTLAPAALLAPLRYVALVWAVVIGMAVWGDMPDAMKGVGAVLIVAAGLAIARPERPRA
ncbi:MAG: DMT family transporter [Alphaproteobacteria bacterium]|nr:DMT family transporter [Alphaproteobacteria bacterium]